MAGKISRTSKTKPAHMKNTKNMPMPALGGRNVPGPAKMSGKGSMKQPKGGHKR